MCKNNSGASPLITKKYWFRPKNYGYGFYPISWEGWISVVVFIGLLSISTHINGFFTAEVGTKSGLRFLFDTAVISGLFTVLFKDKVVGGLQWRWGEKNEKTKNT